MEQKTLIHTARSVNQDDWIGNVFYITRKYQRHPKYSAPWQRIFAPHVWHSDEIIEGKHGRYKVFLDEVFKDKQARRFIEGISKDKDVTFLCFCADPEKCHRTVFARHLVEYFPDWFELGNLN